MGSSSDAQGVRVSFAGLNGQLRIEGFATCYGMTHATVPDQHN
jgi:hypothetical protein